MANDANILFVVDAAQILAKLHLAGIQAVQLGKPNGVEEFIVNTAIKNDDIKAKPDNPGKVTFDLSNKAGEYEVGFTTTIKYDYNAASKNSQGEVEELNKIYTMFKDSSNNEENEEIGKKLDDKKSGDLDKAKKQLEELVKSKPDLFEKTPLKDKKIEDITADDIKSAYEKINSGNKEQNKENDKKGRQPAIEKASENALKQLEAYINVFAGPDKGSKVKSQFFSMPISEKIKDSNDPNLIKVFEIQERPEKELELLKKKAENGNTEVIEHICFIVKYNIELNR